MSLNGSSYRMMHSILMFILTAHASCLQASTEAWTCMLPQPFDTANCGAGAHWSLMPALTSELFGLQHFASNYSLVQVRQAHARGWQLAITACHCSRVG